MCFARFSSGQFMGILASYILTFKFFFICIPFLASSLPVLYMCSLFLRCSLNCPKHCIEWHIDTQLSETKTIRCTILDFQMNGNVWNACGTNYPTQSILAVCWLFLVCVSETFVVWLTVFNHCRNVFYFLPTRALHGSIREHVPVSVPQSGSGWEVATRGNLFLLPTSFVCVYAFETLLCLQLSCWTHAMH